MNLFRSEEHVKNWSYFRDGTEGGIVSLDSLVKLFSGNYFKRRMDEDWVSHLREYGIEMVQAAKKLDPFWHL